MSGDDTVLQPRQSLSWTSSIEIADIASPERSA